MARIASRILLPLLFLAGAFSLFVPLPARAEAARYLCVWEDGQVTEETFFSAYPDLEGVKGEDILLRRGEREGRIASSLFPVVSALGSGDATRLFSLNAALCGLERAAVDLLYKDTLWYTGGFFCWTGEKLAECAQRTADRLVVLSGELPAGVLSSTGVCELVLEEGAFFPARPERHTLLSVAASAPYRAEDGALYLDTAGGRRLVTALSGLAALKVGEISFADEGALLSCTRLERLDLPFAGSAAAEGTVYDGFLAYLFSSGTEYAVPAGLRCVRIRGGKLVANAFYACPSIEEIDLCGMAPADISEKAFGGLSSLRTLHCPRGDLSLDGFSSRKAECGCTVYTKISL